MHLHLHLHLHLHPHLHLHTLTHQVAPAGACSVLLHMAAGLGDCDLAGGGAPKGRGSAEGAGVQELLCVGM